MMKLAVTIDVEEEGLFSKRYDSSGVSVENVRYLDGLTPMFRDLEIRPTLMLAYRPAAHDPYEDLFHRLREEWRAEIGAHLHPWNTPPIIHMHHPEPIPSELIPRTILQAKLETLMETLHRRGFQPRSFRMGRFDLGPRVLKLLMEHGFKIDSSVAPLRQYGGGPNHLGASAEPYFPDPDHPTQPGDASILEVPLTNIPVVRGLHRIIGRLPRKGLLPSAPTAWAVQYLFCLTCQPMGVPLPHLKLAARLHHKRGGRVLTVYFHSSEVAPGGCPKHPTMEKVQAFVDKLAAYFTWLRKELNVEPVTLTELYPWYNPSS